MVLQSYGIVIYLHVIPMQSVPTDCELDSRPSLWVCYTANKTSLHNITEIPTTLTPRGTFYYYHRSSGHKTFDYFFMNSYS